jgi:hypothetical protein
MMHRAFDTSRCRPREKLTFDLPEREYASRGVFLVLVDTPKPADGRMGSGTVLLPMGYLLAAGNSPRGIVMGAFDAGTSALLEALEALAYRLVGRADYLFACRVKSTVVRAVDGSGAHLNKPLRQVTDFLELLGC